MAIRPRSDTRPPCDPMEERPTEPVVSRRDAFRSVGRTLAHVIRALGSGGLARPALTCLLLSVLSSPAAEPKMPITMARSKSKTTPTQRPERLPRHIRPTRYTLTITPDLTTGTFEGHAVISLVNTRSTRELLLNATELELSQASIGRPRETPQRGRIEMLPSLERCRIILPRAIAPGEWALHVRFRGRLNDQLHGFYRSTFTDDDGTVRTLAVTQFEAADARRAFPCWDEPDFKAVFSLTLIVDPSLAALSNTKVLAERNEHGRKIVQFADTIPMSTYLLAFVVGRLEGTAPSYVGKTPIRVWSVPGKSHLAAYGQDLATFSLRFYEEYYGIPYPGDKLDLIAIPDFSHGAMENLGAITFRERALLIDPAQASHSELEGLADVVCHENAHMWFGDLVTMAWWNGLWLNEAFATFLEVVAVDAWKPEWHRWDSFALARAAALSTDGLFASRPVEFSVRAVKDLGAMFDVLTYQKGAAVLRMLEQFLTAAVFRDGVRHYLQAHAYANAQTSDLWKSLETVSSQPISDIMQRWVFSPGYPLLAVSLTSTHQLVIRQHRFTYLNTPPRATGVGTKDAVTRWRVPLHYSLQAGGETITRTLLLDRGETRITVPPHVESVLLNAGGHGYFRVHYSQELRAKLLARLPDGLPPVDRFNLINDAWAGCLAGVMPLRDYLDLTASFRRDRSPHVWSVVLGSLDRLELLVTPKDRPALEAFVHDRLGPSLSELGWEARASEDDLTRDLRGNIIGTLGTLGNDPVIQATAAAMYETANQVPQRVDPNVMAALIQIVAHTGDEARYRDFVARFKDAATPQDERRYLFSLVAFRPPTLVKRTLASTLNGDIRTQDGASVVGALLSTPHGRELAWAFTKANWKTFTQRFPPNSLRRLFGHLPGLATPELERDVHRFVKRQRLDLGGKALAQYLEQLRIAVAFRDREAAALRRYLRTAIRSDSFA